MLFNHIDSIQSVNNQCQTCHRGNKQARSNIIDSYDIHEVVTKQFHLSVNTGPSLVCKSCSQVWLKQQE